MLTVIHNSVKKDKTSIYSNESETEENNLNTSSKILFIILLSLFNTGCGNEMNSKSKIWNFDSIQYSNELYLFQTDDRFGEWGGNTYFIRLYRPNQKDSLRLDYKEYEGKVGPPEPPDVNSNLKINWFSGQPVINEKLGIIATVEELKMISNAIQELLVTKVNNDEFVAMSGIINRIMYSDSSLIVEDYPSISWEEFQKLKRKITME